MGGRGAAQNLTRVALVRAIVTTISQRVVRSRQRYCRVAAIMIAQRSTVVECWQAMTGFAMHFVIAIPLGILVHIIKSHFGILFNFAIESVPKPCDSRVA